MSKNEQTGSHFAETGTYADAVAKDGGSSSPKHQAPEQVVIPVESVVEPERKSQPLRRMIALIMVVFATFGAGYLYGVYTFQDHFMPNTYLDGVDVSLKEVGEVADVHVQAIGDYSLSITGQDFTLEVPAKDLDLKADGEGYARAALKKIDPWTWPMHILERHVLTGEDAVSYDVKKLDKVVGEAVDAYNAQAVKPENATITYDDRAKRYAVTPEKEGNAIERDQVLALAREAVASMETTVTLDETILQRPTVFADDPKLNETVANVNSRLDAVQTLTVDGKEVYTFDSEQIARFSSVSDKYEFTMDGEAVREWAQGELSEQLDSQGGKRTYTRPDGKSVTVSGGTYGWNIDGASVAQSIVDNVLAGKAESIEIPMFSTAEVWNPGGQDWGKRYIDIDLSEQHVRMYDDSGALIWESDCVSGKADGEHETPTGVYYLNDNRESGNIRLEGLDDEHTGKPEYVSYVTYWMPFIWNAVALHDANWRYSFGGDIYQYDGSHGCVNLPPEKAEALFGITQVGDVVITHY